MNGGLKYALELIDKNFGVGIKKAKEDTKGLDDAVNKTNFSIKSLATGIAAAFSIDAIMKWSSELMDVLVGVERLNTSITLNSGKEGQKNIEFLDNTIKRLKLNMESSEKGFDSMNQKMFNTGLTGENVRGIFEATAVTSVVMRKDINGIADAFGNLAKKGKISSADFQSEMGSKIPGALHIAAKAMGVSDLKMQKLFDKGKISADKFLPQFASQLKTTFASGVPEALDGMNAAINNKANAAFSFQKTMGAIFEGTFIDVMNGAANFLTWIEGLAPLLVPLKEAIGTLAVAFKPIWDALLNLLGGFGTVEGSISGLTKAINFIAPIVEVFSTGLGVIIDVIAPLLPWIGGLIGIIWALNIAMMANPAGLVLAAIVALIGGISIAYQKVGWFRGAIDAAWTSMKGFGVAIKDYVINRFKELLSGITGIGSAILKFFQGDFKGAMETGKKATADMFGLGSAAKLANDMKGVGKKAGESYNKGVLEAEANKKKAADDKKGLSANEKLFGADVAPKLVGDGTVKNASASTKNLPAGGGRTEKHTTFNIQSFVREMKIVTTGLGNDAAEIKRQMQIIFNEIVADLEVRADA